MTDLPSKDVAESSNGHIARICTAYESGVGRGMSGCDLSQPYADGCDEAQAYFMGWASGRRRREQSAAETPAELRFTDEELTLIYGEAYGAVANGTDVFLFADIERKVKAILAWRRAQKTSGDAP